MSSACPAAPRRRAASGRRGTRARRRRRRDVGDRVGHAGLVDRRHRVAAADDRRALAPSAHGAGHGDRAGRERRHLEHAHRAVPDHGLARRAAGRHRARVGLGADVEAHPVADRGVVDLQHGGRGRRRRWPSATT